MTPRGRMQWTAGVWTRRSPTLAARLGVRDGMVFRRVTRTSWAHLGGIGRGRGWAGVVEVDAGCDPLVELVPATPGALSRVTNVPPARLLGPYYCVGGALVRVSEDVLVVLGNPQDLLPTTCTDEDLIELARLLEATVEEAGPAKRLADELELLHAVRAVISLPAEHADEALSHVLKIALDSLSCEVGVIRDGRGRWARSAAPVRTGHQQLPAQGDAGPAGRPVRQRVHLLPGHLTGPHRAGPARATRTAYGRCSPWPSPSRSAASSSWRTPWPHRAGFTALCVELGKHIAEAATVVAHTAALREELREAAEQHASLARLDPLTGLGNRLAWDEALSRAQEHVDSGGCVTVITLDIDGLKRVNDTEGHAAGDALLRRCASIIRENVRGDDVCARLGGDEFAVLIPHPEEQAERVLGLLRDRLNGVTSTEDSAAASIGMATTTPRGRVADAVREADLAMYAVKRGRRANAPAPLVTSRCRRARADGAKPRPPTRTRPVGGIITHVSNHTVQTIAYPSPASRPRGGAPDVLPPHVIVLFGATGDLARRKLLPGHGPPRRRPRWRPDIRVVGTSLEDLDDDGVPRLRPAGGRRVRQPPADRRAVGRRSPATCVYVPQSAGPEALAAAVAEAEAELGAGRARLHYLSVPPKAALAVITMLRDANLVERSRVVMEKPFGTDLDSAIALNDQVHETFRESQIFRIDHFLGKEAAQNILAFRFANGLFEPIWNRNFIDHIQIDIPETLGLDQRASFYEATGAYKDMVVTHLFQVMAFVAMEPPTALEPRAISEEKNKVFRSMLPIDPADVVRGQYTRLPRRGRRRPRLRHRDVHRAARCGIDNWRWAGVPFYLRTGKRMAEGQRIISIAFKEAPRTHVPGRTPASARQGPDHLTFDLADDSKVSLSFYGKRPGPGMKLDKLQHAVLDAGDRARRRRARGLRAADPRRDARRPHPVHHRRGHREPVGALDAAAGRPAAGEALRARHLGSQRHPPADRAARLAAAVRAGLAREEVATRRPHAPRARTARGSRHP